jgi:hypothetical protein
MKLITLTAVIASAMLIFSCANKKPDDKMAEPEAPVAYKSSATDKSVNNGNFKFDSLAQQDGQKQKQLSPHEPVNKPDWNKKIIKNASVNLEVKDYNSFYASLREKVRNLGGYIAQEEQNQSTYKIENTMSIKVPVDQFDNAVVELTANAEKINEKKITSLDVTSEVVDTKARMEAKKKTRQRYMDLLGQAKNMEEILNVQSEINGIQEEIESAEGRVEYLTHSAVFSTINLTYYQVLNSSAQEPGKPSFGQKIVAGLATGWELLSGLFIGLITIWPMLLATFILIFLFKRLRVQKAKQA